MNHISTLFHAVSFNVSSLKGLWFIYDTYPGLTTGATFVSPSGLG